MGGGYQYPWQWETLGDIMWDGEEKAMHNQQPTSFFTIFQGAWMASYIPVHVQ